MGLLKEFFTPKNKKDAAFIAVLFITMFGFFGYQVYAIGIIMENPYRLGLWHTTKAVTGWDWQYADYNELFGVGWDQDEIYYFRLDLHLYENMHVKIEFDPIHCIFDHMYFITGALVYNDHYYFSIENHSSAIYNRTVIYNLRDMNYREDYDALVIRVINMANTGIELLHRVTLVE